MENQLLLPDELKKCAQNMEFSLIAGKLDIDTLINKIEIPNLTDFLEFHIHVENKLLFLEYEYELEEDYIITDEDEYMYEEYEDIIKERIKLKITKHNKAIKKLNFDKPYSLLIYYIKDGFVFYNYTIKDDNSTIYETTLEDIIESAIQEIPQDKLEEIKTNRLAEITEQMQKLKDIIFSDAKFKTSTNDRLRRSYGAHFFRDKRKYIELTRRAGYIHPNIFIEEIWREFKEKGLHK
ncbi:hypothetical protein ACQVPY_15100 [Bacillus pretiosus]|uniref:hypothetical protein n=1 Tax=Bacillus pretiosus TaxID=2983392 RepID=UPI003D645D8F